MGSVWVVVAEVEDTVTVGRRRRPLEHTLPLVHMTASQHRAPFKNANRVEARHLLWSHPALGKGGSSSMPGMG